MCPEHVQSKLSFLLLCLESHFILFKTVCWYGWYPFSDGSNHLLHLLLPPSPSLNNLKDKRHSGFHEGNKCRNKIGKPCQAGSLVFPNTFAKTLVGWIPEQKTTIGHVPGKYHWSYEEQAARDQLRDSWCLQAAGQLGNGTSHVSAQRPPFDNAIRE